MKNLLMTVLGMVAMSALTGCVANSEPARTSSSATTIRSSGNNKYHGKEHGKDHAKEHGKDHAKEHGKDHAKNDHSHACGPAHHWDGSSCVHNGNAKGHDK